MVNPSRSIITRIYLYAAAILIASSAAAFFIGRALVDEGHGSVLRQFGDDEATYIGRQVEQSMKNGAPSPETLDALSEGLHVRLEVVPWSAKGRYPAGLATTKQIAEPDQDHGPWRRDHWVRLDEGGVPKAALEIDFQRPPRLHPPRPGRLPLVAAVGWMVLLGLMVVPPLWWWVLRPLNRMVAVADRLGHGDLATPVSVDRTDEFGELEHAFESMRRRVQQMLAARERLLRDISHELRGPLSRMAIALSLAREDHPSPYLDTLERDIGTMDGLIGEILALARGRSPEALAAEPVDLAELAQALLDEREVVLSRRRTPVSWTLDPAPVKGDRRLLARAMGNLLDNALKYTPDLDPVRLETAIDGSDAVFRVIDRGPGIAASDLPHLFEPFYRPDTSRSRETGGTGLGLAIAKAIAEAHQGEVRLQSAERAGTTAELRVPTAD